MMEKAFIDSSLGDKLMQISQIRAPTSAPCPFGLRQAIEVPSKALEMWNTVEV